MYEKRFYRDWTGSDGLETFEVAIDQSDLLISADRDLKNTALGALKRVRQEIQDYIASDGAFARALKPHPVPLDAPSVITAMAGSAAHWQVGPMAAVAGAVAQAVALDLLNETDAVIVENGGDVFAKTKNPLRFAVYAGEASPFSDKLRFVVNAQDGIGVCTSSKTVGPSLSLGNADAVVAIADDAAFADAAATAIANQIACSADVDRVLSEHEARGDLKGLIACQGNRLGLWGDIELVKS